MSEQQPEAKIFDKFIEGLERIETDLLEIRDDFKDFREQLTGGEKDD
jgi:uncharacterized protein (UPF0335 family)